MRWFVPTHESASRLVNTSDHPAQGMPSMSCSTHHDNKAWHKGCSRAHTRMHQRRTSAAPTSDQPTTEGETDTSDARLQANWQPDKEIFRLRGRKASWVFKCTRTMKRSSRKSDGCHLCYRLGLAGREDHLFRECNQRFAFPEDYRTIEAEMKQNNKSVKKAKKGAKKVCTCIHLHKSRLSCV